MRIKQGDCVDFGDYGYGYIIRENEDRTEFCVTIEESDRTNPYAKCWYVPKNCAERIIEDYEE